MPLSCDCFPGCWAKHSEQWPKYGHLLSVEARSDMYRRVRETLPYGTYVWMEDHFRLENAKLAFNVCNCNLHTPGMHLGSCFFERIQP